MGAPDALRHRRRHIAQIGDHRRLAPTGGDGIAGALRCVVGGGKGLHLQCANGEGLPRPEGPHPPLRQRELAPHGSGGAAAGVQRHVQLLGESGKPGDMVGVLMGHQHAGEALGRNAQRLQGGGNPPGGNPRVNEHMSGPVGHQGTVATGSAGQGCKCQHKQSLLYGRSGFLGTQTEGRLCRPSRTQINTISPRWPPPARRQGLPPRGYPRPLPRACAQYPHSPVQCGECC